MTKKLLLIFTLLVSLITWGQTYVSGGINQDTFWTLQNSPYIITGDTVIFGDNTLTIEPGVVVRFDNDVQLRIQGSLIAIGDSSNTIIFTSNDPNPQRGSWHEINLEFNAVLQLDYVEMEYADNALYYSYINTSSYIRNSIFQSNNNAIEAESGGQFALTIESVRFIDNDKGVSNYHDDLTLLNCEFINNRIGAELVESNVDSCLFEQNSEIGLDGHTSTIQNSTFIFNNIGLEQSFSGGIDSSIMIGNTIKDNSIGVKIRGNNPMATFTNNTVCNNTIYNIENTSSFSGHDLSDNCWCTSDTNEIEDSIFHGLDDINFGVVTFTPTATGCPDSTLSVTDVLESNNGNLFYPNPIIEELHFFDDFKKVYEIYAISGVLVEKGAAIGKINLSNLNAGLYVIKVEIVDQSKTIINKLIKN